jgi:hypothetical protein
MDTIEHIKTSVPAEPGKRYLVYPNGNRMPLDPLPKGQYLVHNNKWFCSYRIWVQEGRTSKSGRLIRCHCDLGADLGAADIPKHYRVPKYQLVRAEVDRGGSTYDGRASVGLPPLKP